MAHTFSRSRSHPVSVCNISIVCSEFGIRPINKYTFKLINNCFFDKQLDYAVGFWSPCAYCRHTFCDFNETLHRRKHHDTLWNNYLILYL